jgi:hypothetical protein
VAERAGAVGSFVLFVVHTSPEIDGPPVIGLAASSVPAKQRRMKGEFMKKATPGHKLTAARKAELEVLAAVRDTETDTSEMPEPTD